jgi:hypothetical protein
MRLWSVEQTGAMSNPLERDLILLMKVSQQL